MQETLCVPTVLVSTASHDVADESMREVASLAFALAVAEPFNKTGLGETLGLSVGFVLSYLNGPDATRADVFPALSVQLPFTAAVLLSGPL
jgi:hypothetical protein